MRLPSLFFALFLSLSASAQTIDRISVSAIAGQSPKTWHGQVEVEALNFEFAHALSPRTEVAFVLSPMNMLQPKSWFGDAYGDGNERVRALAGTLLVRRMFGRNSSRVQFYGEAGTGPMWAERAVPASTSRFNFATEGGVGVVLLPSSRMPVVIGYRFLHISNGGYAPRNPGLNLSAVLFGVRWQRHRS